MRGSALSQKRSGENQILLDYLDILPIPTPFPVGPVNVYLAKGDDGLTLIDVGPRFEPAREALREQLAERGYGLGDVRRIILTHAHSDHCGLAGELAEESGVEVYSHPANFSLLADYATERERWLAFYAALMQEAGMPPDQIVQIDRMRREMGRYMAPVRPTGALEEGSALYLGNEKWQVLHTPGHSGGLICLYQPQRRLLISSDHLLRDISSNPIVEPPEQEGGERPRRLAEYLSQLQRIAELPIELALPGHGPFIPDVRDLVARRLMFHDERARQIAKLLQNGARTAYDLTLSLFPRLDPVNRFLAVSEVIGHLEVLELRGEVVSAVEDGIRFWQMGPAAR
ncbi:MAG: MBL fold metallo-hydrolase [Anaerolineae bacterium]|jgi:glyoxylase-like metal-dependent hydrolase (beta-lactamase superfamily II)